jgi:hypothetical protein
LIKEKSCNLLGYSEFYDGFSSCVERLFGQATG